MKLTAFTDFSLRVLIYLATQPHRRVTVSTIRAAFGLSDGHLRKIVNRLGARGWIHTLRGRGGGLELARPPESIRIGDVVRDTEGAPVPAQCFSEEAADCAILHCCALKQVFAEAVGGFYAALDRATLADVCRNPQELSSILVLHRRERP